MMPIQWHRLDLKASSMMSTQRPRLDIKPIINIKLDDYTSKRIRVVAQADPDPRREADSGEEEERIEEKEEELESLEGEAMEGHDDGREPSDYDRRAHIFDESAKVFEALRRRSFHPDKDDD
ncbi:uncharacterized protein LOC120265933 [Dioscorea cayenensis subsp. rotundata]|uniref:Uncharacterized protein LOC120265933 n=1 Tax=Dioscorea cayennensis subsp. rotundata TaxID=55577 RepID=A0AB40BQS4_DIOCR|nr:uncharacterized protein LOC120265933 [Dioscorea cayenensis subsp. rotundata]